jgi:hypothetical protein
MAVESYSATVEADGATVEATGATVLVAPYTVDDSSNSFCSAALLDAGKWTEVTRKAKTRRPGRPPTMQGSTERSKETSHVKNEDFTGVEPTVKVIWCQFFKIRFVVWSLQDEVICGLIGEL